MIEAAIFYLVITMAGASPSSGAMIGPLTQSQCEARLGSLGQFPEVMKVACKKAIGMRTCVDPNKQWQGTVCPIFEGETVQTGKPQ